MRMKLPGTFPPKVQKVYSTPSANRLVTSLTSRLTITFVPFLRVMGGGTFGASASTVLSTPTISGTVGDCASDFAIQTAQAAGKRPRAPSLFIIFAFIRH